MGTLNITEFEWMARAITGGSQAQIAELPPLTAAQDVTTSGTSAQSAAFHARTRFIRVATDTAVRVRVSTNPTALATDSLMPAGSVEYFAVGPEQKLAAIDD